MPPGYQLEVGVKAQALGAFVMAGEFSIPQ